MIFIHEVGAAAIVSALSNICGVFPLLGASCSRVQNVDNKSGNYALDGQKLGGVSP
jgi:hypothetical protein